MAAMTVIIFASSANLTALSAASDVSKPPAAAAAAAAAYAFAAYGDPATAPDPIPEPATDKPSVWAQAQVNGAIAVGLVPQSLQSDYSLPATRADFCALAVSLYENVMNMSITGRVYFDDSNDINIEKAASIGIIFGVGDGLCDPGGELTREHAAAMLSRLAEAIGKPFEKAAPTFADNNKLSPWSRDAAGQVQAAEIMSGVGGNYFAPKILCTREQSIITIMRLYDYVG